MTTRQPEPTPIRITETKLSDGSLVYGVLVGETEIACPSEAAAYAVANAIDAGTLDTRFDGWATIRRAA
jgi:hypothetical protein